MVETDRAVRRADVEADPAWNDAPYPAVVVAGGTVSAANAAARALLPRVLPGTVLRDGSPWLADAHEAFTAGVREPAPGTIGGRSFEAHGTERGDGAVTWWLVDDSDVRLAREQLRVERERTALLGKVSSALLTSLNPDRCRQLTAQLAADHLADAALVIVPGGGREFPVTRCTRGGTPVHDRLMVDPDEVAGLGEALQGFPPVPSRWIDPTAAPDWLMPEEFGEIGSIVVTPLPGHGVPAGALVLLRRSRHQAYTEEEEVFARLFAARAGSAISAARLFAAQASITETLMRELLPPALHHVDGVEFAGRYRPASDSERVGGDFYDVHPTPTGSDELLAVLGDVCGKGLEAAVMTGKVRSVVQALLPMSDDHSQMLSLLNNALLTRHDTRFVTLVLASVSRSTAGVRLRLTSGGHLPPLVVRANGVVEQVPTSGTLVGVLPHISSTTAEVVLAPGETCLLYTDGITEAVGGPLGDEMFGEERLQDVLAACAGMPAEAVAEHVHMVAAEWIGGGRHDDIALLTITAPRGRHLTAVGGHGRGRYTT